ncbi:MAG: hypothetical protein WCE21_02830 [Candidatus Babeliales bacterium]
MKKIMLLTLFFVSAVSVRASESRHEHGSVSPFNNAESLDGNIDINSPEYLRAQLEKANAEKKAYLTFIQKSIKNTAAVMTIGDMMQRGFSGGVTSGIAQITSNVIVGSITSGALMIPMLAYDKYIEQKIKASGKYAQTVAEVNAQTAAEARAQLFGGVTVMNKKMVQVPGVFQEFSESIKYAIDPKDPELKTFLRKTHGELLTQTLATFTEFSEEEHEKNMATATELATLLAHVKQAAEEKTKLTEEQQKIVQESINTDLKRAHYLLLLLQHGARYDQPGYTQDGRMVEDFGIALAAGTVITGIATAGYTLLGK